MTTHAPAFEAFKSVPNLLIGKKVSTAAWANFQAVAMNVPKQQTATLVARIATATDPLLLWLIHQELDKRDLPPAFRWPVNHDSPQMEFITWLADLYWFTRRMPNHRAGYKNWQRWFNDVSDAWHTSALTAYSFAFKRGRGAAYFAKGLALSERDRRELMTMKTSGQIARLRPVKKFARDYRQAIFDHASAKPDKSGARTPDQVANRRYAIWRVYLLADGSETTAARQYEKLYGEVIARQNLSSQVELAREAWKSFGPLRKKLPLSATAM